MEFKTKIFDKTIKRDKKTKDTGQHFRTGENTTLWVPVKDRTRGKIRLFL